MAGTTKETGQGQKGICLRAGIVPMEKDALRTLQCDSHFPPTDGTCTEQRHKKRHLVMCYVNDVVIATPTLEDHIERLDEVFV